MAETREERYKRERDEAVYLLLELADHRCYGCGMAMARSDKDEVASFRMRVEGADALDTTSKVVRGE